MGIRRQQKTTKDFAKLHEASYSHTIAAFCEICYVENIGPKQKFNFVETQKEFSFDHHISESLRLDF